MANEKTIANAAETPTGMMSIVAPLAGWLVPGLGHIIQKCWIRGLLIFASISIMFFAGLGMQGKIYGFNVGDLLDMLGFIGDFGTGVYYFASHAMDWGQGSIFRATADYGTKFIVCAGLLNVIAAIDAHQIAIGKKK
jgi:hypothetical protein